MPPPPILGDAYSARSTCVLRGAASAANGPAPICESAVHGMEYSTSRAWSATIILRKFIKGSHLRHSPPSLLMFGNNYLKQLAFGARANSPVPSCRSSNCHDSECSRCARRIMLLLKVVMVVSNLHEPSDDWKQLVRNNFPLTHGLTRPCPSANLIRHSHINIC